jgi:hypothetical protein
VGGTADTPHGELLRAVVHLYHDLKRYRFRHVADRWGDWCTVCAHRDRIASAIGPNGTWVLAVVDRAITERYLWATCSESAQRPSARFPAEVFETLVDGCVLAVEALHAAAA